MNELATAEVVNRFKFGRLGATRFDEPTQFNIAREIQRCSLPTVLSNVVRNAPDCHTRSLL